MATRNWKTGDEHRDTSQQKDRAKEREHSPKEDEAAEKNTKKCK